MKYILIAKKNMKRYIKLFENFNNKNTTEITESHIKEIQNTTIDIERQLSNIRNLYNDQLNIIKNNGGYFNDDMHTISDEISDIEDEINDILTPLLLNNTNDTNDILSYYITYIMVVDKFIVLYDNVKNSEIELLNTIVFKNTANRREFEREIRRYTPDIKKLETILNKMSNEIKTYNKNTPTSNTNSIREYINKLKV